MKDILNVPMHPVLWRATYRDESVLIRARLWFDAKEEAVRRISVIIGSTPDLSELEVARYIVPKGTAAIPIIKQLVAEVYGVDAKQLKGRSRKKTISEARRMAIYLSRKLTDASLGDIGDEFNRDHSTVVYAINAAESAVNTDKALNDIVETIKKAVKDV